MSCFSLKRARAIAGALVSCLFVFSGQLHAQSSIPYTEIHTVAAADQPTPKEFDFSVSIAGTYNVTLTDLGATLTPPAPLGSVKLAVTNGSGTIVGTPMTAAGTSQITAAVGSYRIHVVGAPGSVAGSGAFGVQVTDSTGNTLYTFVDSFAPPPTQASNNQAVLNDSFMVSTAGSYTVTLTDFQLPQALTTLTLVIVENGGSLITVPPLTAPGSTTVTLQTGVTYRIFAVGVSDPTVQAGLYSAVVAPTGSATPVYSKVVPIGTVSAINTASLSSATQYTFALSDLSTPAALTSLGGAVTVDGSQVAKLTAAGSQSITGVSGSAQVFLYGAPAASPGLGSYSVSLTPQGAAALVFSARAVAVPGGTASAYSFDSAVGTAGTYSLNLSDFTFPSPLSSITVYAVQGGAIVGTPLTAAGSQSLTVATGPLSVLVFGTPGTGGSLFGIDLVPSGGGTSAFAVTQGIGTLFSSRQLAITAAGTYQVNVSDVGFPSAFSTLAVLVTQGSNRIGSIFTGGTFEFTATPGNYFINFVAQPSGTDHAGTYSIGVTTAPPVPTVTLSAGASSIPSGGTVNLKWSSQNADTCTATGGWSGTLATSGTQTSAALSTATTFTLTCTGSGGTASQSVTVSIDPAKSSGGGAVDPWMLLLAAGLVGARSARLRFRAHQ